MPFLTKPGVFQPGFLQRYRTYGAEIVLVDSKGNKEKLRIL
jgi:hypothetical protein